jgi:hypothetical protein
VGTKPPTLKYRLKKARGPEIPATLLARAHEVIESMLLLQCMSPHVAHKRPSAPPPNGPLTEVLRTNCWAYRHRLDGYNPVRPCKGTQIPDKSKRGESRSVCDLLSDQEFNPPGRQFVDAAHNTDFLVIDERVEDRTSIPSPPA